jgi:osmotically-inducible protein OsmY
VRRINGVKGASNVITIKPRVEPTEIRKKIQEVLRRNAGVDANRIMMKDQRQ